MLTHKIINALKKHPEGILGWKPLNCYYWDAKLRGSQRVYWVAAIVWLEEQRMIVGWDVVPRWRALDWESLFENKSFECQGLNAVLDEIVDKFSSQLDGCNTTKTKITTVIKRAVKDLNFKTNCWI